MLQTNCLSFLFCKFFLLISFYFLTLCSILSFLGWIEVEMFLGWNNLIDSKRGQISSWQKYLHVQMWALRRSVKLFPDSFWTLPIPETQFAAQAKWSTGHQTSICSLHSSGRSSARALDIESNFSVVVCGFLQAFQSDPEEADHAEGAG